MTQPLLSQHYVLELQLKEDKKKWYVFTQGISPLFYRLEGIRHFRILKQWVHETEFQKKELTWRFLQFQRIFRRRNQLRKLVIKHFRSIETGQLSFLQLMNRIH